MDAVRVAGWVLEGEPGGEQGGVEEEHDEVLDGLVVLVDLCLGAELLDDGVLRVDLHGLLRDHVGGHGGVAEGLVLHDLLHVRAPAVLAGDEDARGGGEAAREDDLLDLVAEDLLDGRAELLEGGGLLLALLLLVLGLLELEALLGEADELLVLELLELLHDVLVDRVDHEEDLHVAALGLLEEGGALELLDGLAGDVVDALLALLHARDVVLEARRLVLRLGAAVAEELGHLGAVGGVLVDAELDVLAELLVELLVVVLVRGDVLEELDGLLDDVLLDDLEDLVLLEGLAGDVQREVLAVDDAAEEREPLGADVLAVVHDEDAADVELDVVALLVRLEHVEGRALRRVEDGAELELALDAEVLDGEVVLPVVADGLVERGVLLWGDLLRVARPDGLALVEHVELEADVLDLLGLLLLLGLLGDLLNLGLLVGGLLLLLGLLGLGFVVRHLALGRLLDLELDVVGDELGVLLDEVLDAALLEVLELVLLEEERDDGPALDRGVRAGGDREGAAGGALPDVRLVVVVLGRDADALGDEVGGVEPDTELADHAEVSAGLEGLHEVLGAAARDRSEVVDEVSLGHAETGVDDGEGLLGLVRDELDVQRWVGCERVGVREGLVADLVERIGRVAHELAEEDLLVAVERVDDQGHQLIDFSLECEGFRHCEMTSKELS